MHLHREVYRTRAGHEVEIINEQFLSDDDQAAYYADRADDDCQRCSATGLYRNERGYRRVCPCTRQAAE